MRGVSRSATSEPAPDPRLHEFLTERAAIRAAFTHQRCLASSNGFNGRHSSDAGSRRPIRIHCSDKTRFVRQRWLALLPERRLPRGTDQRRAVENRKGLSTATWTSPMEISDHV